MIRPWARTIIISRCGRMRRAMIPALWTLTPAPCGSSRCTEPGPAAPLRKPIKRRASTPSTCGAQEFPTRISSGDERKLRADSRSHCGGESICWQTTAAPWRRDSVGMKHEPPPNKPPGKRGVNKATMDEPQEEFVDDQRASRVGVSQSPEPSQATPGRSSESDNSKRP